MCLNDVYMVPCRIYRVLYKLWKLSWTLNLAILTGVSWRGTVTKQKKKNLCSPAEWHVWPWHLNSDRWGHAIAWHIASKIASERSTSFLKGRSDQWLNPRPVRAFLITRTVRGGGGVGTTPPWRSAPDGRRASRKKPVDAPRRDLAIAHIVFSPRSKFDLLRSGQRSNFREKWHFLSLHAHSGVSMCRSDLKPSPACSPFNSEQYKVLLLYPAAIFSIRSAPK